MITFECVDCRAIVYNAVAELVPADQRCMECRWLVETIPDPREREMVRAKLNLVPDPFL